MLFSQKIRNNMNLYTLFSIIFFLISEKESADAVQSLSWKGKSLVLKIPKDFPENVPIFSASLVRQPRSGVHKGECSRDGKTDGSLKNQNTLKMIPLNVGALPKHNFNLIPKSVSGNDFEVPWAMKIQRNKRSSSFRRRNERALKTDRKQRSSSLRGINELQQLLKVNRNKRSSSSKTRKIPLQMLKTNRKKRSSSSKRRNKQLSLHRGSEMNLEQSIRHNQVYISDSKDRTRVHDDQRESLVVGNGYKNLFKVVFEKNSDVFSLFLQRKLTLQDYIKNDGSWMEFPILGIEKNDSNCDSDLHKISKIIQEIFTVKLIVIESFDCGRVSQDMCFLPQSDIELQQKENAPPEVLFGVPPLEVFCPEISRTININMKGAEPENSEIAFDQSTSEVKSTMQIDRENRGSWLHFNVRCEIQGGKAFEWQEIPGHLFVIDENDEAPIRLRNQSFVWRLSNDLEDLDDKLMIIDPDVEMGSGMKIRVEGPGSHLVKVVDQDHYSVTGDHCHPATSEHPKPLKANCTVITPRLIIENVKSEEKDSVNFSVIFDDTSLVKTNGNNPIWYNVTLALNDWKSHGKENFDSGTTQEEDYLRFKNVTIGRYIANLSRLTQIRKPFHELSKSTSKPPFVLSIGSQDKGVNLTPNSGIIYVSDLDLLQRSINRGDGMVKLIIHQGINFTSNINILWLEELGSCVEKIHEHEYVYMNNEIPTSCAVHSTQSECESYCGLGSSVGRCSWRKYKGFFASPHYATCSPDLSTCPDGVCDELEKLDFKICPQDCVLSDRTKGKNFEMNKRTDPPRGIAKGFGVCTCNDFCQCFPIGPSSHTMGKSFMNSTTHSFKSGNGRCDAYCQTATSIGGLATLLVVAILLYKKHKSCRQKMKERDIANAVEVHFRWNESLYTPGPVLIPRTNQDANHSRNINTNEQDSILQDQDDLDIQVDPRWELSRDKLQFEDVIGEGEFGKVMKAKCFGIPGAKK